MAPSVKTCMSVMLVTNCNLLSPFVGCYINCKNIYDTSNIKFACLCSEREEITGMKNMQAYLLNLTQ